MPLLDSPVVSSGSGLEVRSSMSPSLSETWFTRSDHLVYASGPQLGSLVGFQGSRELWPLIGEVSILESMLYDNQCVDTHTDLSNAYAASYPEDSITLRIAASAFALPCCGKAECQSPTASCSPCSC